MKCLYEVLEVARDADDSAIRSAYRKLALKWHPGKKDDKNQDNLSHAEEVFKEIQNAYEILSDPHERSWYDSHRDAILRSGERHQAGGGADVAGGQRPADEVDLYTYFTSACFSGFGDGPRGFYAVYDELFTTLGQQEAAAEQRREERGGRRAADAEMPRFGHSSSPWPEVAAFYAAWGGFSTAKDFAWADQYNPAAAPNRMVRRRMEQENDKARKAARREYNEQVRELVAFLRKRDKRVAARQVEEARLREEREREERERREQERRDRQTRAAAYEEAAWVRGDDVSASESDEEELGEEEQLVWFCVACEKHFKSQAAFDNHERSKKHLEAVELLRAVLQEDEGLELEVEGVDEGAATGANPSTAATGAGSTDAAQQSEEESGFSGEEEGSSSEEETETESGEEEDEEAAPQRTAAQRTPARSSSSSSSSSSEEESDDEEGDVDEDAMLARLLAQQRRSGGGAAAEESSEEDEEEEQQAASASSSEEEEEEEAAEGEDALLARMASTAQRPSAAAQVAEALAGATLSDGSDDADWGQPQRGGRQRGGGKGRRPGGAKGGAGRPQQAQQPQQQGSSAATAPQPAKVPSAKERKKQRAAARAGAEPDPLTCQVCQARFDSRSKLFAHIRDSGHAALKR